MSSRFRSILWFLLSFGLTFGGYVALSVMGNWSPSTWDVITVISTVSIIPICIIGFIVAYKRNRPLARGFIWGLAGIFIFFFTYGGCGIMRLFNP
jgi:hypothetical protein